jgi:hypothetical protein
MRRKQHDSLIGRIEHEAVLARSEIRRGRFQRSMALITAFSAIVSGFEAYVQHERGAFSNKLMWTPIWLTPPVVITAAVAIVSERIARLLLPILSLISLIDGVVGFIFHLRGIKRLPGGFKIGQYNLVMGPPVFAPLLTCIVGVTGILAGLLRREEPASRLRFVLGHRWTAPASDTTSARAVAHGRFQRWLALTTALFGALAGAEAYFEHLRGSFNQRVMWTPVWATPPIVAAALGAVMSKGIARVILPFTSISAFFVGVLGFVLHLRGIKRMPGGYANVRFNVTMGPPMFAPLLFASVGLLGLIASMLRRRER